MVYAVEVGKGRSLMTREELLERISIDPKVCFGKPCVRGWRIWVSLVLDLLAGGMKPEGVKASPGQPTVKSSPPANQSNGVCFDPLGDSLGHLADGGGVAGGGGQGDEEPRVGFHVVDVGDVQ